MISKYIMTVIVGAVLSAPALSYTGSLPAIPPVPDISVTYSDNQSDVVQQVNYEDEVRQSREREKERSFKEKYKSGRNNILIVNGNLKASDGFTMSKDEFNRVVVKILAPGVYKYTTNSSMRGNGELLNSRPKMGYHTDHFQAKSGDQLLLRGDLLYLTIDKVN